MIICLLLSLSLGAQVYVAPGGMGNGDSWAQALGSVRKALETGNAEIRVAAGTYELDGELIVAGGQTISGGWASAANVCYGDAAERTILRATGRYRVATVAGTMKGFTLTGGLIERGKGGGVYVKNGGMVENCIIKRNIAGTYYPRVGDVYCSGGVFLRKEEITAANAPTVAGIVFWVNPDTTAVEGQRGWVVALTSKLSRWAKNNATEVTNSTGEIFQLVEEALKDTAGFRHTAAIVAKGSAIEYPAAYYCHNLAPGGIRGWHLPALGQLAMLAVEKEAVENTYDEIRKYKSELGSDLLVESLPYFSSTEYNKGGADPFGNVWGFVMGYNTEGGISAVQKYVLDLTLPVISF